MNTVIEKHVDLITATLSCFDRMVITGTMPKDICYSDQRYLNYHNIRLFDYP